MIAGNIFGNLKIDLHYFLTDVSFFLKKYPSCMEGNSIYLWVKYDTIAIKINMGIGLTIAQ
ncbi:MAG: hypothetical protein JWQ79_1304 [Mucilaginibacter sp.]|nr:hypothetical protein [Mucilaginibacter sp.]